MYDNLKNIGLELDVGKPVSDNEISKFEQILSIKFGHEYEKFLKEFGCLSVDYLEFYGICGNNNSIPSAIHATKVMRREINNFSKDLIVVMETGDGSFYALDSNDNVYFCNYTRCKRIDKTFKEFIFEKLEEI